MTCAKTGGAPPASGKSQAAAQSAGWNESTINAMGATACAKKWGVKEGTSAFDRACAEYNRGVVASLRERATRTARSDDEV